MRNWPALTVEFPPAPGAPGDAALPDLVAAELDGLDVVAIAEPSECEWQVFFRDPAERAEAAIRLGAMFSVRGVRVSEHDVPDGDWARRSQAALVAIRVGALTVAPPWDAAAQPPGDGTIVIEPAMGFGSGHHATTRLCLAALQRVELAGRRVLDIGTGSGVLALAAARLGAGEVVGIDVDEDALANARTNASLNGNPAGVAFWCDDFRHAAISPADVVVANLTGAMLAASVLQILRCCRRPGTLVLSGVTREEAETVASAFGAVGPEPQRTDEDGWCAFVYAVS